MTQAEISTAGDGSTRDKRPHVVLIVADDMGYGDLGCYGATKVPTPSMDALAVGGVRATDCHAASAVCSPSRYAILTGRYAWRGPLKRHVLFGHAPTIIETDRPTIASVLRDAGYATGAFGKWHLGLGWRFKDGRRWSAFEPGAPLLAEVDDGTNVDYAAGFTDGPAERGFDRFFGIAGSIDMPPYCFLDQDGTVGLPSEPKRVLHPAYGYQRPGLQTPDWEEETVDVRFTEEACRWIRAQARGTCPFFCYIPLSAPHRPCLPPEFARGLSQAGPRGDSVCVVDWAVGQVASLLDELGIADDTLLVVTSDNGAELCDVDGLTHGHHANGSWRGRKADIFEGGHREPFIARWPARIPAGTVTDELMGLVDLLPTIAAAAGAPVPKAAAEDAFDVLGVLTGEAPRTPRTTLVHHSLGATFSLRQAEWKLVMGTGSGGFSQPVGHPCGPAFSEGQLYNLQQDPAETKNLWHAHPEMVWNMYAALKGIARGPASGMSFDALQELPIR